YPLLPTQNWTTIKQNADNLLIYDGKLRKNVIELYENIEKYNSFRSASYVDINDLILEKMSSEYSLKVVRCDYHVFFNGNDTVPNLIECALFEISPILRYKNSEFARIEI